MILRLVNQLLPASGVLRDPEGNTVPGGIGPKLEVFCRPAKLQNGQENYHPDLGKSLARREIILIVLILRARQPRTECSALACGWADETEQKIVS